MQIEIDDKDFEFLKTLANTMSKQKGTDRSDSGQARIYGIMETERIPTGDCNDYNCGGVDFKDVDDGTVDYDREELFEYLEEEEFIKLPSDMGDDEIVKTLKEKFKMNYELVYYTEVEKLKESGGLYLTKQDAIEYCESKKNSKKKPKVYQLDETRLGELGRVLNIIEKFKDEEVLSDEE